MLTQIKVSKLETTKNTEKLAGNLGTEEEKLFPCKGTDSEHFRSRGPAHLPAFTVSVKTGREVTCGDTGVKFPFLLRHNGLCNCVT